MKVFLICILTVQNAFACACMDPHFIEKYTGADFVASVKIVKNYKNIGDQIFYTSDIIIQKLYKGDSLRTLYIEGSSDGWTCSKKK